MNNHRTKNQSENRGGDLRSVVSAGSETRAERMGERLYRVYATAREHFGYTGVWWPGTPIELTVTAVLVQQCNWSVAWEAAIRLGDAGLLELAGLAKADVTTVFDLIRPVTFAAQKSARLVQIAVTLRSWGCETIEDLLQQGPTSRVREQLLTLPGIGEETADSILLFAGDRHETFVVDAYARRLFERLQLFPRGDADFWRRPYEQLRRFLLDHVTGFVSYYDDLPLWPGAPRTVALLRDFHAQIVELGRHHCRKTNPRCSQRGWPGWTDKAGHFVFCEGHCSNNGCGRCPLVELCGTAGQNDEARNTLRPRSEP